MRVCNIRATRFAYPAAFGIQAEFAVRPTGLNELRQGGWKFPVIETSHQGFLDDLVLKSNQAIQPFTFSERQKSIAFI